MLGKFLIGSNNYNLDLPESDKDYKIINFLTSTKSYSQAIMTMHILTI